MVLINSTHEDVSTNNVIEWLINDNQSVKRLNEDAKIHSVSYKKGKLTIQASGSMIDINTDEIQGYWFRRGWFNISTFRLDTKKTHHVKLNNHVTMENGRLIEYIEYRLSQTCNRIGRAATCKNVNKLIALETAIEIGLDVPPYIITTSRAELLQFYELNGPVVCKPISESIAFNSGSKRMSMYAGLLGLDDILKLPLIFDHSFFQVYIDKEYDIRSFILHEKVYSAAIISQTHEQTRVDFRKYDSESPNKIVPFKLPHNIEEKLASLVYKLDIDSGSADIVKKGNKFYFLEVNPVGQYDFVSKACNYQLDKVIAKTLLHE